MSLNGLIRSLRVVRRHAYMREMHSLGVAGGVARKLLGIPLHVWSDDIKQTGLKFPYDARRRISPARQAQISAMVERRRNGETLQAIGESVGLTRERVRQLTAAYSTPPPTQSAATA